MIISIVGGKGFIGRHLHKYFQERGARVIIGTRNPRPHNQDEYRIEELPYADVCINVAGAAIHHPWFSGIRKNIWSSRVSLTHNLIERLNHTGTPKLLQASAVGWYGVGVRRVDETAEAHAGWSHDLCAAWETAAAGFQGVRHIMRLGVVLGKDGGFLSMLAPSYRLGMGAILGSGEQGFSWIHMQDLCALSAFLIAQAAPLIVNATSPHPVSQRILADMMCATLETRLRLRIPEALFAVLPHNMGKELFTQTPFVYPRVLQEKTFAFQFPELKTALQEFVKE